MFKYAALFLMSIFTTLVEVKPAQAQQDFLLTGAIFQKQNNQRVADATIANKQSKGLAKSDLMGVFHIRTNIGDTLLITKTGYNDVISVIASVQTLVLQLMPVQQLNEVEIVGRSKTQELNDAMGQYRGQGSFYNGKPPIKLFSPFGGSPITGFYELFGKTPQQARRFQAYAKTETEQIAVDKRFNKGVIRQFTDLKEEQIQPFMDSYRPSYDQLKAWSDYDLINYIKRSADGFKNGKGLPPLQKLY